ncbi:MAG: uroporphyrinogen decarboxylase family protein [Massiliimalia sp.]|jgi:hypothetical protein
MNSRERLTKVLSGELPDRVPISTYELCGYNSRSFENQEPSYQRLMDFIRQNTDSITMWTPPSSQPWEELQTTSTWDENEYHIQKTILHTPKGDLTVTVKYTDTIKTLWRTEHLCKSVEDVDAWLSLPDIPLTYDASDYRRVVSELGDHGIVMASLKDPICVAMELMEFGEATVWALTEPDHFKATLEEIHRRNMRNIKNMLDTCPVDLYRICGPEYATPPYLSPKHFESYVYPYLCDMVDLIHSYGKKVRIHSHGRIGQVLDMILDTGTDAIDPCEAPPDGDISLKDVKKKAAGRAVVFGNLQLKLLENASEQEVREQVRVCMDSAKENGGYVIMPTAAPINIPLSSKTERNYFAFIEEALNLGKY